MLMVNLSMVLFISFPVGIYLLKGNNRKNKTGVKHVQSLK